METIKIVFLVCFVKSIVFASPDYNCYQEGSFRYLDETCKSFYICTANENGFQKTDLTCPENKIFNPTSQKCEDSSMTVCINNFCDNQYKNAQLIDPNNPDCTTYVQCFGLTSYYPVIQRCPQKTFFVGVGCGEQAKSIC